MQQRPKKLLDRVRDAIRVKHDSIRTEHAVGRAGGWGFLPTSPSEMGPPGLDDFRIGKEISQRQRGVGMAVCFSCNVSLAQLLNCPFAHLPI